MEDPKPKWAGTSAEHCQQMIDYAKNRSPMVKFMLEKMEEVNEMNQLLFQNISNFIADTFYM